MTAIHGWGRRLAPLIPLQIFLWLTLILFAYGPWHWPMRDGGVKLYVFVSACHISLLIGYLSAAHQAPVKHQEHEEVGSRLVYLALLVSTLVLPITSYARTGQWIPDVVGGLADPGRAYQIAQQYSSTSSNFAAYLRILCSPWLVILFPLGLYSWRRLRRPARISMLAIMLATILLSLSTGQRRDIADLLVVMPLVAMASHWAGITTWRPRVIVVAAASVALAIAAFTAYFVYSHVSRVGQEVAASGINSTTMQMPDFDNPILRALPDELRPGMLALGNYLSTGYYGLSLALDREYRPMYGLGHSMFLTRNFARLTNETTFESRSYAVQISDKDGFRYPVFWCTAYPYFANDIGFVGTVGLLFLVGRGLALSWIDMLGGRNAHAVVLFALLLTLAFYLPATNRMLQDGEGVVAFYVWLIIWLLGRRRPQPGVVLQS